MDSYQRLTYKNYLRLKKIHKFSLTYREFSALQRATNIEMSKRQRTTGGYAKKPFKKRAYFRKGFDRTGGLYQSRAMQRSGESKWFDILFTDNTLASGVIFAPTLGSWNIIDQGVGESQRIGRKVVIRKIQMKMDFVLQAFAGATLSVFDQVRIIVYLDKQANGAIASAATILQTSTMRSFRNMENIGRYAILYDKFINLNALAGSGDGAVNDSAPVNRRLTFYKDCNIPIEFSGASGAIGEIRSNNIGTMLVVGQSELTGVNIQCRLRFTD